MSVSLAALSHVLSVQAAPVCAHMCSYMCVHVYVCSRMCVCTHVHCVRMSALKIRRCTSAHINDSPVSSVWFLRTGELSPPWQSRRSLSNTGRVLLFLPLKIIPFLFFYIHQRFSGLCMFWKLLTGDWGVAIAREEEKQGRKGGRSFIKERFPVPDKTSTLTRAGEL